MEKVILALLLFASLANAKSPADPLPVISALETKWGMQFRGEISMQNVKVWVFEYSSLYRNVPVMIEVPAFPSSEIIQWTTMSSIGEIEHLFILKTQHDEQNAKPNI